MITLENPDPSHRLNAMTDDDLCWFVFTLKASLDEEENLIVRAGIETELTKIYQILGYRAAAEYLRRYLRRYHNED